MVRMAIQCLPFDGCSSTSQDRSVSIRASRVAYRMRQLRTANRAVALTNRSTLPKWRASTRQPLFSSMPEPNRPASRIPDQSIENIIKRGRWQRTRQHPLERPSAVQGRFLDSLNGKCVKLAQTASTRLRRPQLHRGATQRQTRCLPRHVAPGGHHGSVLPSGVMAGTDCHRYCAG
jgi:hypothetical protein